MGPCVRQSRIRSTAEATASALYHEYVTQAVVRGTTAAHSRAVTPSSAFVSFAEQQSLVTLAKEGHAYNGTVN